MAYLSNGHICLKGLGRMDFQSLMTPQALQQFKERRSGEWHLPASQLADLGGHTYREVSMLVWALQEQNRDLHFSIESQYDMFSGETLAFIIRWEPR